MRGRRMVPTVLAALALAGCVRSPVVTPPATTEAAGPVIELPPRPRDVPLDGLDPCTLLTEPQRAQIGLTRPPRLTVSESGLYRGTTSLCTARGYEPVAITVGVDVVVTSGIERYTVERVDATVTPIAVRDFPAVRVVPPRAGYCTVIVGVAPGQLIDIQFSDGGNDETIATPELCDRAEQVAGLAVDTLLELR